MFNMPEDNKDYAVGKPSTLWISHRLKKKWYSIPNNDFLIIINKKCTDKSISLQKENKFLKKYEK